MEASAHVQLRLLQHWQHQQQPARCPAARSPVLTALCTRSVVIKHTNLLSRPRAALFRRFNPLQQRLSPAAALKRPKWQPPTPDGTPERRGAPRRKSVPQQRPDKSQQTYFARTFEDCRTAAQELLQEGGLKHALASMGGHPLLGRVGFIAHSALVQELRKSLWQDSIPREEFQAVLKAALQQDTRLGRDIVVAGFLSYLQDDSAAAFELLQRLQSEHRVELSSMNYTDLCSACVDVSDPAAVGELIKRAIAQGLRPEAFWYTSWTAAYAAIGDVEGAKSTLKRASAGLLLSPHANRALATAFLNSGNFDKAKVYLDTSGVLDTSHLKGLEHVVAMLGLLGEFEELESLLTKALRGKYKVPGGVWWWAAVAYAKRGQHTKLQKLINKAAAHQSMIPSSLTLLLQAKARAGDLDGLVAAFCALRPEDRGRNTSCCQLVVDAFGRTGAFTDIQADVLESLKDNNSSGLLHALANHAYWLSVHGHFDKAEEAFNMAPKDERQWGDRPQLTADLCASLLMNCAMRPAGKKETDSPLEEQLQERFRLAEALAAKGAAPQPRHRYFDLDLSTDLAWPAQLRLLAWLQGRLGAARSGLPVLEYSTEARFLTKQFMLWREGILAPEDTRAALLGLLHNLGIQADVSSTDQRLVVVQVADLKLAIGARLRRRGSFEAWPNRALLVRPTRA